MPAALDQRCPVPPSSHSAVRASTAWQVDAPSDGSFGRETSQELESLESVAMQASKQARRATTEPQGPPSSAPAGSGRARASGWGLIGTTDTVASCVAVSQVSPSGALWGSCPPPKAPSCALPSPARPRPRLDSGPVFQARPPTANSGPSCTLFPFLPFPPKSLPTTTTTTTPRRPQGLFVFLLLSLSHLCPPRSATGSPGAQTYCLRPSSLDIWSRPQCHPRGLQPKCQHRTQLPDLFEFGAPDLRPHLAHLSHIDTA